MAKAAYIPKHYTLALTPSGCHELIVALRAHVREFEATEQVAEILSALEGVYVGDLGEAPGAPLPGDEGDGGVPAKV